MVLLVGSATVGAGRAQAAASEKETELNARQAFAAARYDEAIELFARLYAETLNPIYLRNIGRCHQKKREPDKAIDAFQDYLAKGKSITSAERKEIQGYIKEMERLRDDQAQALAKSAPNRQPEPTPTFTPAPPAQPAMGSPGAPSSASQPYAAGAPPSAGATTVNLAPPPTGWAYGAPPPGATAPGDPGANPMLVSRPGAGTPPASDDQPVYKRWWFWTAIAVVAAGGVAAALLIPGGVTKPPCVMPARCQ
jgi:hypothetical protein